MPYSRVISIVELHEEHVLMMCDDGFTLRIMSWFLHLIYFGNEFITHVFVSNPSTRTREITTFPQDFLNASFLLIF